MSESGAAAARVSSVRSGSSQEASWQAFVARAAHGDHTALAALYDQSNRLVHAVAYRILADQADAEEVTLDVFTQVWKNAKTFDATRGTVTSWLVTMARSRAIDRLRSVQARHRRQDSAERLTTMASGELTPEETSLLRQTRTRVLDAMGQLPEEQKAALHMAYYGGLSHNEIAGQLGIPLGTIKTRIRLGMLKLREELGPIYA